MNNKYTPTIGLEIHAELKTQTKMFCNSKNDPDEKEPNFNICPICVGFPGTLPTINKEAVRHVLKIGLAVEGKLADFSEFDRKNYFYPDIPKGYQISQYKFPLVEGGELAGVNLERVHLEEDTARSLHGEGNYSLIDFNRSGIPLMELVTKPVIKSAKDAAFFAKELQLLLQYLGAGEANMEKGEMRVEANISISADYSLGTKVEVKNLNSFKSVEKAIEFEIERQSQIIDRGEKVVQETRGWNEVKEETFSQRLKESSHDYRYFPEPDLPKLFIKEIPEFSEESLKGNLPELPWQKRKRYIDLGLKTEDSEFFVRDFVVRKGLCSGLFQTVLEFTGDKEIIRLASNYIISDVAGLLDKGTSLNIKWPDFVELMQMTKDNKISSRGAKDILSIMVTSGGSPQKIAEEKNLLQKSDEGELKEIVRTVIEKNSKVAEDYKNGKESAIEFLIGQGMKESKGSANPEVLKKLLILELGEEKN